MWAARTAGPTSPGTGLRANQPAVAASFGTSNAPDGVSPRPTRPVVCTPMAGTSRATGVLRARTVVVAGAADGAAGPGAGAAAVSAGGADDPAPALWPHPATTRRSRIAATRGAHGRSRIGRPSAGVDAAAGMHLDLLARIAEVVFAGDPVDVRVEVVGVAQVGLERGLGIGL